MQTDQWVNKWVDRARVDVYASIQFEAKIKLAYTLLQKYEVIVFFSEALSRMLHREHVKEKKNYKKVKLWNIKSYK